MGHSVKRKEDPRFIRGQGEYIDDVNLPGQLWLDIVRSPYAHATIKGIDATEALKIPGVLAVITGADLEKAGLHWMPTLAGDKQMVLPTDTVMYQAQEVAAVVATTKYIAADGVAAVDGRLRAAAGHRRPVQVARARRVRAPAGPRPGQGRTTTSGTGSPATGRPPTRDLAAAEVHIERGHLHPAHPRRLDRDVRLRRRLGRRPRPADPAHDEPGAARHPDRARARVSGLPEQNIRVKTHDIGGGFGGKVPVYPGYVLAVVASPDRRQAGQVDRGSLGEPAGRLVRPRLPHPRRAGRDQGRQDHLRSRSRRSPTTATRTPRPTRRSSRPACSTSSPARTTSRTRSSRSTASTPTSRPEASPTAARSG